MTNPRANLPALVHSFFAQHLTHERQLSPCTIESYRDSTVTLHGKGRNYAKGVVMESFP